MSPSLGIQKDSYKKARAGDFAKLTGIDSVYEEPENRIWFKTDELTIDEAADILIASIKKISKLDEYSRIN